MTLLYLLLAAAVAFKLLTAQKPARTITVLYDLDGKGLWRERRANIYDRSRLMALLMRLRLLARTVDGWCPLSIHVPGRLEDTDADVLAHEIAHIPDQHECGPFRVIVHPVRSLWLMHKHGYWNSPLEVRARNAEQSILAGTCDYVWVQQSTFLGLKDRRAA